MPRTRLEHAAVVAVAVVLALLSTLVPREGAEADLTALSGPLRVDPETNLVPPSQRALARFEDGTFVVVYRDSSAYPNSGQWAQRYDAQGAPIGTRALVSQGGSAQPSVAGRDDGSFLVVWESESPGPGLDLRLMAADATPLGSELHFSTATAVHRNPDVAALAGGGFVVVWDSYYSPFLPGFDVEMGGQRFDSSAAPVGNPFHVNSYTTGYQQRGRVSADDNGRFVVVWQSGDFGGAGQDGAYFGVIGRRFDATASPFGTEFVVNTFTTYSEDSPDVAMHSDGSFVVVWRTQYGDDEPLGVISDSVTLRRYASSGQPLGDEIHLNSYITGLQTQPVIAMDDDGSFVVAFTSASGYNTFDNRDGDGAGIFARCFDASGQPVGEDFIVNTYTTADQTLASIASDGDGDFVVAWHGAEAVTGYFQDLEPNGIAVRRFGRGQLGGGGVCGDPIAPPGSLRGSALVTATDALFALQAAVLLVQCELCVCDVNDSGGVTASDALIILQTAVGLAAQLTCPPCA
jgi:hypothetical protein